MSVIGRNSVITLVTLKLVKERWRWKLKMAETMLKTELQKEKVPPSHEARSRKLQCGDPSIINNNCAYASILKKVRVAHQKRALLTHRDVPRWSLSIIAWNKITNLQLRSHLLESAASSAFFAKCKKKSACNFTACSQPRERKCLVRADTQQTVRCERTTLS